MSTTWLVVLGALAAVTAAATCLAGPAPTSQAVIGAGHVVDVGNMVAPNSFTGGIQEAIDSLPKEGGIVTIPPGVFPLRRSIDLRSHMTIRGSGPATILLRDAGCFSPLAKDCPVGATEVEVRDTKGFAPGQEIALRDTEQNGWYILHAIVKEVKENRIVFDRPTTKDYQVKRGAAAIHSFPGFHAFEQTDFTIEDLTLDGNAANQPADAPGDFTMAAVHLHRCTVARVHNVTVNGWPSDGIGVQGGSDVQVLGCTAMMRRGHGFHPGTSLVGAVFTGNIGRDNTVDGLYFCMNVKFITVSNNVFHGNGRSGIGGLGDGFDEWNTCTGNTCAENGRSGIDMSSGKNNTVVGNVCVNNSKRVAGRYPGILLNDCLGSLVSGNRVSDDQKEPTQTTAIRESGKSDKNLITGNHLGGSAKGVEKVGEHTQAIGNLE